MKQLCILLIILPIFAFSDGYEPEEEPVQYIIKDLNKVQYESQFLNLNNSVQSIDTDNKVLKKEVELLKNYFKVTLKNQEYTFKTQMDSKLAQHKYELDVQEKRYEALLNQQVYIFSLIGGIFTALMLVVGFIGYNRIKSMVTNIIKKEHSTKTKTLVKEHVSNPETIKEIQAGLDTLEMEDTDNEDSFTIA